MPTDRERKILEEDYEERAAIKEFEANMPREAAERQAREEQIKRAQREAIRGARQGEQGGLKF